MTHTITNERATLSETVKEMAGKSIPIRPTFSAVQAATQLKKSRSWVIKTAQAHGIGTLDRNQWRFTLADITSLRRTAATIKRGNPNWVPGEPQPHRKAK